MRIGKLIQNLKVGESGYTLPLALIVVQGKDRLWWWMRGDLPVYDSQEDTACMRVERQKNGFHAWPLEDETYFPSLENSPLHNLCVTVHDGWRMSMTTTASKALVKVQPVRLKATIKPKPKSKPVSKQLSEDLEPIQRRNLELKKK